jgi:hypothetical protein
MTHLTEIKTLPEKKFPFFYSKNIIVLPLKSSNEPQKFKRPQITITIQNVKWRNVTQGHSPTGVCRSDSNQGQNLQGEAGWPWNIL